MIKSFLGSFAPRLAVFIGGLVLAAGLVAPSFAFAAGTLYVDASNANPTPDGTVGNPYPTIQAAVSAAQTGDTINVAAGTYSGDVTIAKGNLSIIGTGSVILNLGSGYGFDLDEPGNVATGFTLSGFTVNASPTTTYAFKAYHADGLTLTNDSFNGAGAGGGVDLNSTSNVTLTNVTSSGFHKNGFAVTAAYTGADSVSHPSDNITFNNVTASNNGWTGISFYTTGNSGGSASMTGITFTGTNTISGNGSGIFIEGDTDANYGANHAPANTVTTDGSTLDLSALAFSGNTGNDITNYQTAPVDADGATFNGKTGDQMTPAERNAENAKISSYSSTTVTYVTPAYTVTIDAFVNGAQADATTAASASFPMHAIFPGGEGDYALSTAGFNNPNAYQATTSDMPQGSNYSTFETTAAAANECTAAYPFKLAGYGTGATLADAEAAATSSPSTTVPAFTNLTSNEFVVASFTTCPPAPTAVTPATSGTTVTNATLPAIVWSPVTDAAAGSVTYQYEVASGATPLLNADGSYTTPIYGPVTLTDSQATNGGTPDGTYSWNVRAIDGAGNAGPWSTSQSVTFTTPVVLTSPVVTVTPEAGTIISGTTTFTITVTGTNVDPVKNSHIYAYLYNADGAQLSQGASVDLSSGSATLTVDTKHLQDGAAWLDVGALYGADGNQIPGGDTYFKNYIVDNTGPVVTVTPDASSSLSGTTTFTITLTDANPLDNTKNGHVWVYLYNSAPPQASQGANVDLSSGTGTFTVDTTALLNGDASLDVGQVYDAQGNVNGPSDSYFNGYTINNAPVSTPDTIAPSVPVLTGPVDGTTLHTNNFTFTWDASTDDSAGPVTYEYQTSQDPSETDGVLDGTGIWTPGADLTTNSIASSGAADGTWYWQVRAVDASGNKSAWSPIDSVTLDTAPAPDTTTLLAPTPVFPADAATSTTANLTHVSWTSVDDASGGITYVYQASNASTTNPDGSFTAPVYTSDPLTTTSIPTPGTPDGTYYWHVQATDADSNMSPWSVTQSFIVDNSGESSGVPAPIASGTSVSLAENSSSTPITLTSTAGSGAVYNIVTPPAHGTLSAVTGTTVSYTPDADYSGGDSFTFKANNGSDSNTATVLITVTTVVPANVPPVLDETPGFTVTQGTVASFTATATDTDESDVISYSIVNAPTGAAIDSASGEFTWDTTGVTPGEYDVALVASDGTDDSNIATTTITVAAPILVTPHIVSFSHGSSGGSSIGSGSGSGTSSTGSTGGTTGGGEVLGASTYNFAVNLKVGSRGEDVTQLQMILIADGYLNITAPTGYFGAMTKAAVKLFQAAHNISPVSGYVGPITRSVLNAGNIPAT